MDTELFELCKEVYELTEWGDTENELSPKGHLWPRGGFKDFRRGSTEEATPLYTSDYSLDKLPMYLGNSLGIAHYLRLEPLIPGKRAACYGNNKEFDEWADTPLRALLKLTIALHEAGQLETQDKSSGAVA